LTNIEFGKPVGCSSWKGTVCGMYPLSATVIVPSLMGTSSVHGVRHVAPPAVRALAPGGADSIRTASVGDTGWTADKLELGIPEQADTNTPHAVRAKIRLFIVSILWRAECVTHPFQDHSRARWQKSGSTRFRTDHLALRTPRDRRSIQRSLRKRPSDTEAEAQSVLDLSENHPTAQLVVT
jgi:hypothetical protein